MEFNFETWLFSYHIHIVEMRNIFATKFSNSYPEYERLLYSEYFFIQFAKMLWETSSKRIPKSCERD